MNKGVQSFLGRMVLSLFLLACTTAMPSRPSLGRRITLTDEQLAAYDRDGVVLVKGVLTGRKLRRAQAAAYRVIPSAVPNKARHKSIAPQLQPAPVPASPSPSQPHSLSPTQMPLNYHCRHYSGLVLQGWRNNGVLRSVACDSTVPDLVAQVMRLRPDERLRVLKAVWMS